MPLTVEDFRERAEALCGERGVEYLDFEPYYDKREVLKFDASTLFCVCQKEGCVEVGCVEVGCVQVNSLKGQKKNGILLPPASVLCEQHAVESGRTPGRRKDTPAIRDRKAACVAKQFGLQQASRIPAPTPTGMTVYFLDERLRFCCPGDGCTEMVDFMVKIVRKSNGRKFCQRCRFVERWIAEIESWGFTGVYLTPADVMMNSKKEGEIDPNQSRCEVDCQGADSAGNPCPGRCKFCIAYLRRLKNSPTRSARCSSCMYQEIFIGGHRFLVMNGYEAATLQWAVDALRIPPAKLHASMRVKFEVVAPGGSSVEGGLDAFPAGKTYLTDGMFLGALPAAAACGGSQTILITRSNLEALKKQLGLGTIKDCSGAVVCLEETKSTFILVITPFILSIFSIVTTVFGAPMMVVVWDFEWERSTGNKGQPRFVCRTVEELDAAIDECRRLHPTIVHAPKYFDDEAEEFMKARAEGRLSKKRDAAGQLPGDLQREVEMVEAEELLDNQI